MDFLLSIYNLTKVLGIPSFAFSIFVFALLIKTVLFPLAYKQAKSMKYTQAIQPKLQLLQKKYKNNKEKLSQETMALYKRHQINPMAGCLPLLIQLPILIALFQSLREFNYDLLDGSSVGFFWIENLKNPDPWVLPVVVAISTFLQSKYSMMTTPQTAEGAAKSMQVSMLYVMPLMMGWFSRTYPAGLSIYWITFTLLSLVQQWITNRMLKEVHLDLDEEDIVEEKEEKKIKTYKTKKLKVPAVKRDEKPGSQSNFGKPLDFSRRKSK
jgi:YidC/Oxa1 family membrane protein insertase